MIVDATKVAHHLSHCQVFSYFFLFQQTPPQYKPKNAALEASGTAFF